MYWKKNFFDEFAFLQIFLYVNGLDQSEVKIMSVKGESLV